jgi:hypothetical protein
MTQKSNFVCNKFHQVRCTRALVDGTCSVGVCEFPDNPMSGESADYDSSAMDEDSTEQI